MSLTNLNINQLRANLSPEQIQELLSKLTDEEAERLMYDWSFWARPEQLEPEGDWFVWNVLAGRGFGKMEPKYQKILTISGWKVFGDLEVGDQVYDEKGEPTTVTGVYPQPKLKAYRVHFSDGAFVDCGEEHLWTTWTHRDRKQFLRPKSGQKRPNGEFPPKDWAGFKGDLIDCHGNKTGSYGPKTITTKEVLETLVQGKRGDLNHCIPLCKPLQLTEKRLYVDPYLLGLWLGDGGCSTNSFTCHSQDAAHYKKAILEAGYEIGVYRQVKENTFNVSALDCFSKDLKRLGTYSDKSIPEKYLQGSISQRLSLLQGLMDSDGYVGKSHVEFCAKRKEHADAVLWLARSLGQKPVLSAGTAKLKGKDYGVKYRVTWTPAGGINPFRLARKASEVSFNGSQNSRNHHRMITDVEYLGEKDDYLCISVDSKNHLYLTGEALIPTHNTRLGAEWIIKRAWEQKGPIVIIGETAGDVRDVMVEVGESSIMKNSPPWFTPVYEPSKRRLTWPNGVTATTFAATEPDQLRGPQSQTVWADEVAKWKYDEECWDNAVMGCRLGSDTRMLITTTPRPKKLIKQIYKDPSTHNTVGSTFANAANLNPNFIKELKKKYEGTRIGKQELYGEILWESELSLFSLDNIDRDRVQRAPKFTEMAIGVDPSVSTGTKSTDNDTGIAVGGVDHKGEGFLIEDGSLKGSPAQWAQRVGRLWRKYNQEPWIIAEKNNGGQMVMETLTKYGIPEHRIILVSASQGKVARAEPISLLSEQARIHHVGEFVELEAQLVEYDGTGASPDRYDAYVWLFTWLMMRKKNYVKTLKF